jgi:hypothetical protein
MKQQQLGAFSTSCKVIRPPCCSCYKSSNGELTKVVAWFFNDWSYIISDSDLIARESANSLQRHIEQQIETDSTLSERLKALQLPSDVTQLDHLCNSPHSKAQELENSQLGTITPTQHKSPSLHNLDDSPAALPVSLRHRKIQSYGAQRHPDLEAPAVMMMMIMPFLRQPF